MSTVYSDLVRREPYIVSRWRLNDPAASTQAFDTGAHNSLNGFFVGSPVPGPSLIQGDASAASYSFTAGQSVTVADIVQLRMTTALSLEAWVVPRAGAQNAVIVGKTTVSGIAAPYALSLVSGSLVLQVGDGITSVACSGPAIPVGIPTLVQGTYFRGRLVLYVNGQKVQSVGRGTQAISDGGRALNIAGSIDALIAEVAVYSGALSALRCTRHFALGQWVISDPAHFVTVDPPAYQ